MVSAPGLVFFIILMSLAAVDWLMSLDPHWYSTIYGLILVVGQALSALSFAVAVLALLLAARADERACCGRGTSTISAS